jgi:hypothetical protein
MITSRDVVKERSALLESVKDAVMIDRAPLTVPVVVAALLLAVGGNGTASAQRPESVATTPSWPSRYRGWVVVAGQVIVVDPVGGTATVVADKGAVISGLSSNALPGVRPGSRVEVPLVPSGRPPSAVGGEAAVPGVVGRIIPPLPLVQPRADVRDVP